MPLLTTVIGSYPKPDYLKVPDWFRTGHDGSFIEEFNRFNESAAGATAEEVLQKAIKETLDTQSQIGLEVITDGEMRRVSYVHHFCRGVKGISFQKLTEKKQRCGAVACKVPTVTDDVSISEPGWVAREWIISQNMTAKPVKATVPGPITIADSVANQHYSDMAELSKALVSIINGEILALANAGCKYIQVDDPVLVRYPDEALSYGIDNLVACFKGVPDDVTKITHICCGYPTHLDQDDYLKADKNAYLMLADKLDTAGFHQISLEDAHRNNDLELFKHFKKTKIILGVLKIASSKIESVTEIKQHIAEVLTVVPAERLILAPDCGLAFLPHEIAQQKLKNLVEAAHAF